MRTGLILAVAGCAMSCASADPVRRGLLDASTLDGTDAAWQARTAVRLHRLGLQTAPTKASGLSPLAWPLQPAPSFTPWGYTAIVSFLDHDARYPGFVQDYACGPRAYDTADGYNHRGTDYALWPFPWLLMDAGDVRIVAAAGGTIIEKHDGFFDRSCAIDFSTSSEINAVFIRQDDGLTAWYLHMKQGSVTQAPVGSRIEAGDYLGLVGSSGPSRLPHLHFQLSDDATGQVIDPYHGACNVAPDRWLVPQVYEQPRILDLTTHSAEPETVDCGVADGVPVHDTLHAQQRFRAGDAVWVYVAFGDHRNGEIATFDIRRPDGSVFQHWSFDLADEHLERPFYSGTAWDWNYPLPADAPSGTWIVQASFAGQSYSKTFMVGPTVELDQRGLSGSWANPATPGQGLVVDVQPDFFGAGSALLFGGWFAYDASAAGGRRWYTLQGSLQRGRSAADMPIYATTGGAFDAGTTTTTVPVGTANLRFDDCMHGTLAYRFTDASAREGTIPLTRLLGNASCGDDGDAGTATRVDLLSGTWADPSNSGQGLVLDLNAGQHLLFGAWYTFAAVGGGGDARAQRWYTLQSALPAGDDIDGIGVYETTGGSFDGTTPVATRRVGSARLRFANCTTATLDYAFDDGENAGRSGTLALARLTPPPAGCSP